MPVLEMTAAGLEPSKLQRLLPKVARPAKLPPRALRASRWLHGTLEAEPEAASHRLVHSNAPRDGYFDMFTPSLSRAEPLNASAFLLDFLYPKGALNYIRRLSSGDIDRHRRPVEFPSPLARNHRQAALQYSSISSPQVAAASAQNRMDMSAPPTPPAAAADNAASPASVPGAPATHSAGQASAMEELERLLRSQVPALDANAMERAWGLYRRLDSRPDKADLGRAVLAFLAPSRRHTEAHRVLWLFGELGPASWDAASVSAAVKAHMSLNHHAEALSVFQRSIATEAWANGAAPGLDHLVLGALRAFEPDLLSQAWGIYKEKTGRSKADKGLLAAVSDLPDLAEKLRALRAHIDGAAAQQPVKEEAQHEAGQNRELLQEAYKAILEASLPTLDPDIAFPFVKALDNPRVFEDFLQIAIAKKRTGLAARAYAAYRLVQGYRPRTATLVNMVREVYYPDNARGMEDVLKDWYSSKGRLNRWGYQKYLAFYASRGDVTSVYRLWNEFTEVYPDAVQKGQDTFAHLLRVHAVRGDLPRVERAFSEIHDKYGVRPNTICWNIRLHIHVERGDYRKAMKLFEDLCESVQPDDYSFGTIMSIVGRRGDLSLVSDLYWLAQQCHIPITEAIMDPLVEAYCQNDLFDEAERLCVKTTREARPGGKPFTAMWNTLLHHHAFRHDLVTVNRILNVMTRLQVPYNDETYSALLFTLAQCRQPRRAVELLRAAQEDGIFRPNAHHYTLLMMAYIRSKQPHRALQVNRLMHHMGFQRSSQQILTVIKAFSQWQDYPKGGTPEGGGATATERRELFAKALREFQRSLTMPDTEATRSARGPAVGREAARMHLGAVRRFSFVIFMLVQARDFAGVEEVMQLYRSIAPIDERQQPLPLKLCNALMLSDYSEGRYDRVKEMWQAILERTKDISRPQALEDTRLEAILGHEKGSTDTSLRVAQDGEDDRKGRRWTQDRRVVAKLRYGLTDSLKTMQRLYAAERDANGLMRLVNEDVLGNGFLLDSKNWNHYVQNLARLGRTREAFGICEDRLMHHWSGFATLRGRYSHWNTGPQDPPVAPGTAESHSALSDINEALGGGGTDQGSRGTTAKKSSSSSKGSEETPDASHGGNSTGYASQGTLLSRLQRLRESATRYNRPTTYTFMVLAKAYLEMEQMAVWSSVAERQFRDLTSQCPKSVHAVRTMARMNSRIEGRVFGYGDTSGADSAAGDRGGVRSHSRETGSVPRSSPGQPGQHASI